jgi:nicotinamide mononucleotide transporter
MSYSAKSWNGWGKSKVTFFDIHSVMFTAWGYQMSYLEFTGTMLNLASVWLATRNSVLNWPIGIVAVALYACLFYQIQLYSDLLEQVYFVATGFWGWHAWARMGRGSGDPVGYTPRNTALLYGAVVLLGAAGVGAFMSCIHDFLPALQPASYPYLDAFLMMLSFAATVLLIHRRIENWYLWILIDVLSVWLYGVKGVILVMLTYAVFLVLAIGGLVHWRKLYLRERTCAPA